MDKQKKQIRIIGSFMQPVKVGEPAYICEYGGGYRQTSIVSDKNAPDFGPEHFFENFFGIAIFRIFLTCFPVKASLCWSRTLTIE